MRVALFLLSVAALTACDDDASEPSVQPDAEPVEAATTCESARAQLCAKACECGADVTCVYFPAVRDDMEPLRTTHDDESGCVFSSRLQCDQAERKGDVRDWANCVGDLDGVPCVGAGARRGVEIPRSCELTGDADNPLSDLEFESEPGE